MSLAAVSSSVFKMAWSISIPYLVIAEEANLRPKASLVFLGSGTVLAIVAFFSVPEIRGKTFHELDNMFIARLLARNL